MKGFFWVVPAAKGMVAVATATVCKYTFSLGPKAGERVCWKGLNMAKPNKEACKDIMDIQPVCRPKYMFEKHMRLPIKRPKHVERI